MNSTRARSYLIVPLILIGLVACRGLSGQVSSRVGTSGLAGTSWQLVEFQGGDGARLIPDDRSTYTIAFGSEGRVTVRIDCNRGSATWRSAGASQLQFGALALTRMLCPRGSLHDQIVRQWPYVRTYTLSNGHLFLSLMADGGIYEFEPLNGVSAQAASVRGTATYRERIALPANAVFEVSLEAAATRGAPAGLIARVRNEQPGNPPISFLISYDPGRISRTRTYVVRARILVDGQPWFTTEQSYPVLTGGRGSDVQLLLRRTVNTGPGGRVPPGSSRATLENTYWRLTTLGNTPVRVTRQREPNLTFHPTNRTVTGSGGCNRISGNYQLRGDRVTFGRFTTTMMACADGMDTERAYLTALSRATRWRITGQRLELLDTRGVRVAGFDAVYM